jgi:hypothetical protein
VAPGVGPEFKPQYHKKKKKKVTLNMCKCLYMKVNREGQLKTQKKWYLNSGAERSLFLTLPGKNPFNTETSSRAFGR